LIAATGLLYLSRITPDGGYLLEVLPALILLGVGMAMVFVPLQNLALTGVAAHDAGAAGATANAAMQIGGSIGLSIFTTLYAGVAGEQQSPVAFVDGYSAVFVAAAIGLVVASVVAVAMIRVKKEEFLAQAPKEAVAHLG
ncbi:MFS transporter, partial [Rathayibacter sp. AY1D7]